MEAIFLKYVLCKTFLLFFILYTGMIGFCYIFNKIDKFNFNKAMKWFIISSISNMGIIAVMFLIGYLFKIRVIEYVFFFILLYIYSYIFIISWLYINIKSVFDVPKQAVTIKKKDFITPFILTLILISGLVYIVNN